MKKTIVYIDGYNLYYGMLKGTSLKWLDLSAFARALLATDHDIVQIKYFTACALTYPHDSAAIERQNIYHQALHAIPGVKIISGFYKKTKVLMPVVKETCKTCDQAKGGLVRVVKLEEKRSDVNLAVELMLDAAQSEAEALAVITGDSDQVGAIEAARRRFSKTVLVFNLHESESRNLKKAASYYKNIPREILSACQLPDIVPIDDRGHSVRRPDAWR